MSGGMIVGIFAATVSAVVLGVLTGLLTKEAEGLIDALPGLLLRLARRRLPAGDRDDLYGEWAAELHIALHRTEDRPLSRLLLGVRYSAGLPRTARRHRRRARPGPAVPFDSVGRRQSRGCLPGQGAATTGRRSGTRRSDLPNVTLQVVPFAVSGHAPTHGPFTILRFAERDLPDVVYLKQLTSALYLDNLDDVSHSMEVMEWLCVEAMSAGDILGRLLREL